MRTVKAPAETHRRQPRLSTGRLALRAQGRQRRQRGSILILTLFAIGMIAGAYLYIGVIGSRSAETTRARTAGDATAMAAAIVKARALNYEAFILLADSIFLPLKQVTDNIVMAQVAVFNAKLCPSCLASLCRACPIGSCAQCIQYGLQMATTASKQPAVKRKVDRWLEGLEDMASAMENAAPYWAENWAMKTGLDSAYSQPKGVQMAASFPTPDSSCGKLGVEMIDNAKKHGPDKRDACHDMGYLEWTYLYMKGKPAWMSQWNAEGYTLIFKALTLGADCDKQFKQPSLKNDGQDWKSGKYRYSRGMAMELNPNDHWQQAYLESLRRTNPPKTLGTGWLLGMGCAEHYSQEFYDKPSLWTMDWRARLVPCDYEKQQSVDEVTGCGSGSYPPYARMIQTQFQNQLRLNIARHWKW